MSFLSKYGVARHIYIAIPKAGSANHAVSADWTPAAGDVKISKDGGAAANVTNLPTAIAMGNSTIWDFSLTATEMQAAQIMVTVADSATKAVDDTGFIIETYGDASGQHALDLDTALSSQTVGTATSVTNGVTVTTNNDKTGYSLSAAGVQAVWDALTAALTTANSIGKLLVDNINATISSRLASASYTAPLDAAGVRAAVGLASANLDTQLDALPTAVENADALLNRDMSVGTDDGSATVRTVRQALRFLRNKWSISGTTLTVTKEDDTTTSWTAELTTNAAADPVTASDPASA